MAKKVEDNLKFIYNILKDNFLISPTESIPVDYGFHDSKDDPDNLATSEYIVYTEIDDTNVFSNDNISGVSHQALQVTLYTKKRNAAYEDVIEALLKSNRIRFNKIQFGYINPENLYQVVYDIKLARVFNPNI